MNVKHVALLFDGWKRFMTTAWTDGIVSRAGEIEKRTGEQIRLVQFQCWGNASKNRNFDAGEYSIFDLPDLSWFDGIICDLTNIRDEAVVRHVTERIRASHVPAVSLCLDAPGMVYAGVDGRDAETKIIDHLYRVHHCRSFFFAGGPENNYENLERLRAYQDCMKEYGIPEADSLAECFGTYEASAGVRAMQWLLAQNGPLPDAIVCANDNIAVGVITEAEKHGLKVPKDVLVTGFDCFDKATYFDPQITSAETMREEIGVLAMDLLHRIWQKEEVPKYNYVPSKCHFAESCGCPNTGQVSYRSYVKNQILGGIAAEKEDEKQAQFESDLMECTSFGEIRDCILKKCASIDDDGAYIVLDERMKHPTAELKLPCGYDHTHLKVLDGVGEKGKNDPAGEDEEALWKYLDGTEAGKAVMVTPLHMKEEVAGYLVICQPRFIHDYQSVYRMHEYILHSLQTTYDNQKIAEDMRQMKILYERDRLTGVYQRAALSDRIQPAFDAMMVEHRKIGICFADADHFKEMNDTRGHEFGDRILCRIASVMEGNLKDNGYVCRYGGDEFLAILELQEEEELDSYCESVVCELQKPENGIPAIDLSIGAVIAPNAGLGTTLDDYIRAADREMYQVKAGHHRERK